MATPIFAQDAPPAAGPYSHAVKTAGVIYCSGQIHMNSEGKLVDGSIADKTALCVRHIKAVLAAAGSSIDKVVKTTVFLSDMAHFAEMNGEYEKHFSHKPARSCVAVKTLPKNADVEIEVIALA
ncbi:probable BRT1 protein, down-regulated by mating factor B [Cephalotrichum gorgonifer]|uniref:Probable BRT1 protein, down-regulated by mating factor B n=1 Tax=Cephalotrichum gorgonifer TaxID=2041049 RepID=A0AAE8SR58_9PEZI|nr:probable BRT1 protein, down-regulated by mating factor B [Cephalotrichum gorgonifer]